MNATVKGSFHLKSGTELIPRDSGGIVFSPRPLRAVKINGSAFKLLQRCRDGLSLEDRCFDNPALLQSTLSLFDRLCQSGLLEWRPPTEGFEPFVSIVIAVFNRAGDIAACIESLLGLDYPPSKREIIVVDDASTDPTCSVVSRYDVKLVRQEQNLGQSAARNVGVSKASGEIVAFVDSDCIAEPGWLRELVPYFQDSRNALVGGYVASYYRESLLDRYEDAKSPLNMGEAVAVGSGEESDFYVPCCNMLVRKDAFVRVRGLNEDLRVGEDVDFCWKLKEHGLRLVYAPRGRVRHKHRNRLADAFKRRFDYGTSEPVLYSFHQAISKRFPWQPACMAVLFACVWGLLFEQPWAAAAAAPILLWDAAVKKRSYEDQIGNPIGFGSVLRATLERHFELIYHLSSHLVRYHLILMILLASVLPPTMPVAAAVVLLVGGAEFFKKSPRLFFPVFLIFFLMEQISYQAGVFCSCVKLRSFRPYKLVFVDPYREKRIRILRRMKCVFGKARRYLATSE